ncbi:hypothetical protein ACFV6G_10370 [Streptomyces lavendulae]|uniref:hypothetical protein n=1 Tax=Streptomyces lavendulae TaxID=1914 RepID=UPI0036CC2CCD
MTSHRRPARPALTCTSLTLLAALAVGCSGTAAPREAGGGAPAGQRSDWVEGTTVDSVAQRLHLPLPPTATDARAAHRNGFQGDDLLLSFVLPTPEVDAYLTQLKPERPLAPSEIPFAGESVPAAPFTHVGLPEPDSVPGIRKAQVCAPCANDIAQLHVAVAQLDAQTSRVYIKTVD